MQSYKGVLQSCFSFAYVFVSCTILESSFDDECSRDLQ
jgi:hypothetical protein